MYRNKQNLKELKEHAGELVHEKDKKIRDMIEELKQSLLRSLNEGTKTIIDSESI